MAKTIKVPQGKSTKTQMSLTVNVDALPPTECWPLATNSRVIADGEVRVVFSGKSDAPQRLKEKAVLDISLVKAGKAPLRIGFSGAGIVVESSSESGARDVKTKVTHGGQKLKMTITKRDSGEDSIDYKFSIFSIDQNGERSEYLSVDPKIIIDRP